MNRELLQEMRRLVEAGERRQNASALLNSAAAEMARQAEALKAASRGYAAAASQLHMAFNAAHEMSHGELNSFKKLFDYVEETTALLKKHTLRAETNAAETSKLAQELSKDIELPAIPPEPDPKAPLVKAPPVPKPKLSPKQWGLASKPGVNTAVAKLNKAGWKVIDLLDDELPPLKSPKDIDREVTYAFERYLRPLVKEFSSYALRDKKGGSLLAAAAQEHTQGWVRKLLNDPKFQWKWVRRSEPKPVYPSFPGMEPSSPSSSHSTGFSALDDYWGEMGRFYK